MKYQDLCSCEIKSRERTEKGIRSEVLGSVLLRNKELGEKGEKGREVR